MSMIARFTDIVKSNINAQLDKMEDPSKMIDQLLYNAIEDLAQVKKETAGVMAEEKRCKRILDDIKADVAKYEKLAEKAVLSSSDEDALVFLAEKAKLEANLTSATQTYEAAYENSTKMRQMHDKLTEDINALKARKNSIKANIAVAETQQRINKMGGVTGADALSKFDSYEEKAQNMLDKANAEAELNRAPENTADTLAKKYDTVATSADAELAALKAKLGM